MSELAVGSLAGLAANSYVIDVASGSQLTQPGMVLQAVSTTKTDTFSASVAGGSFTDITGLSVSITPTSSSSRILVQFNVHGAEAVNGAESSFGVQVFRDSTAIGLGDAAGSRVRYSAVNSIQDSTNTYQITNVAGTILDSPATTSATTYKVQIGPVGTGGTVSVFVNRTETDGDITAAPRTASTITVMEIAG